MSASSHKYNLLKRLFDTGLMMTATDFSHVSNANQYFVELENQDLITSKWGEKGSARVKLRFIAEHQREKAQRYLNNMSIEPKQDEAQESLH